MAAIMYLWPTVLMVVLYTVQCRRYTLCCTIHTCKIDDVEEDTDEDNNCDKCIDDEVFGF